ncbi:alcohol dehydrogenase catalytic domain-containing protein [Candidatus Poribacteria bacterium]|nr:alcohol dehydrogenase catalytic domain-containing protein [Candidatus Poribacteria bacterium]
MRAAICEGPQKVLVKDIRTPNPSPGDVLIKVWVAGVCGSDVRVYMGKHPEVVYPIILGHEFSGEIAALGEGVDNFNIGDEVIVDPTMPCGECYACYSGNYNLCSESVSIGYQLPGAFAEYTTANANMVHLKDEDLTLEEAALINPLAVAIHAVKRAGISIGEMVVILGAGTVGLLTMQVAKQSGAKVISTDVSTDKLHLAAALGADYVINSEGSDPGDLVMELTKDQGVDAVIECAGTLQTELQMVDLVKPGGKIVMVGWTGNKLDQISLTKITLNEINLLGSANHCNEFSTAVKLATSGLINLNSLISHEFDISETAEALEEMSRNQHEMIKPIISFLPEEDEDEYEYEDDEELED